MKEIIKIREIVQLTHDVLKIQTDKPGSVVFQPGEAADIAINLPGWEEEIRAFTFTSLPQNDFLEFTIKTYPSRHGVTAQLLTLVPGNELVLHGIFGAIAYKGEGVFIAGGAGITPFIPIFRKLEQERAIGNNKLLFANKISADIIHESYFSALLGNHFINVLSEEHRDGYEHGYITEALIRKYKTPGLNYYYLCGPDPMMDKVSESLTSLGIDEKYIVREAF